MGAHSKFYILAGILTLALHVTQPQARVDDSRLSGTAELKLGIHGYIKPHCAFYLNEDHIRKELTDSYGQAKVQFEVNCNQFLNVEISSRNGGLKHTSFTQMPDYPGFDNFLPYNLTFAIDALDAQPVMFESQSIKGTHGEGSVGVIPFQTTGYVMLDWAPGEPLVAGNYRDVIEIRVIGDGGMNSHW